MVKWGFRKNSQGVHHGNQQRTAYVGRHHPPSFQSLPDQCMVQAASGKPIKHTKTYWNPAASASVEMVVFQCARVQNWASALSGSRSCPSDQRHRGCRGHSWRDRGPLSSCHP